MNETTRTTIWSILNESFNLILQAIRNAKPETKMNSGHHHNDAFLFRAYAEYSVGGPTVVISFDMQEKEAHRTHFSGDIAMEDGVILKEIMETSTDKDDRDEITFIKYAKDFSLACQKCTVLIEKNLVH